MCECLWVLQQLAALFVCLFVFLNLLMLCLRDLLKWICIFQLTSWEGRVCHPSFSLHSLLICQRETLSSSSSASSPFPPELGHRLKTTGFNWCFHTTSYIYCFVVYDYLQSLKNKGKKTSFQYFCEFILVIWHYKETMHLKGLSVYFYMK